MDKAIALETLQSIQSDLEFLSRKARRVMKDYFPDQFEHAEIRKVFDFGRGWNPYDITFETILEDIKAELEAEEFIDPMDLNDWFDYEEALS